MNAVSYRIRPSWIIIVIVVGGCSDQAGGPEKSANSARLSQALDTNADVVVRQVYGGWSPPNKPSNPTYPVDFIELFNRSTSPVSIGGWSLQYGSLLGLVGASAADITELPNVSIQPGRSFLVGESGANTPAFAPIMDFIDPSPISMDAQVGKVALVNSVTLLNCAGSTGSAACSTAQLESIVDLVGYTYPPSSEPTRLDNFYEGSGSAAGASPTTSVQRRGSGTQDTNDNSQDFEGLKPILRNSTCAAFDPRIPVPIDRTVPTNFAVAASPLYEGASPSQTPVLPGTIVPERVAIVQGRVTDTNGIGSRCIQVSVSGSPEYGSMLTWADGSFAMAVNGGSPVTIKVTQPGFYSAYRTVDTKFNGFFNVADVRLVPVETGQAINSAQTTLVAGAVETDGRGTRQALLVVPPGTQPTINGLTVTEPYSVSVKEVTNLATHGRDSMPASLPPQSAFTYAVQLSVSGYEDHAATFNKKIPVYVHNFLGFNAGETVPVGRYDVASRQWVAEANGVVVKITGASGGQAVLNPMPSDTTANELTTLASNPTAFPVGGSFWRFTTDHFSPWDLNWGWGPPPDASGPNGPPPAPPEGPPCGAAGSIIECQTQVLREEIPVTATDFKLVYTSGRQLGSGRHLQIPLTGSSLPPGLKRVELAIRVGGRTFTPTLTTPPIANQFYDFSWDGRDASGRPLSGPQLVLANVGFVYDGSYQQTARFGYNGNGISIGASATAFEVTLSQAWNTMLGEVDAHYPGLGGWTLDVHHVMDPLTGVVYLGNGEKQGSDSALLTTVAGPGLNLGTGATINSSIAVAPNGDVYFTQPTANKVSRISSAGVVSDVGPANVMNLPSALAFGPDGALYIADSYNHVIRKYDPSTNTMPVHIGTAGSPGATDGGLLMARLNKPSGMTVLSDGTMYIADTDNNRIRRVRDGIVTTIVTVGGTSTLPCSAGTALGDFSAPTGVAAALDGTLYVSDHNRNRIAKIAQDGTVTNFAGNGATGSYPFGDGAAATCAQLNRPDGVALGPDGLVYLVDKFHGLVRRVLNNGTIQAVAGTGGQAFSDNRPPLQAALNWPRGFGFAPDGTLYVADTGNGRIRKVVQSKALALAGGTKAVASPDGKLFKFDTAGRHLSTMDTHTGVQLYTFSYIATGFLDKITDQSNRETKVLRNASGVATGIRAPDQQVTSLTIDSAENLTRITRPDSGYYSLGYSAGTMLTSLRDPKSNLEGGGSYTFSYSNGLLVSDKDPRPGVQPQTLSRIATSTSNSVTLTSPDGHERTFTTSRANGERILTVTHNDQTQSVEHTREDDSPGYVVNNVGYTAKVQQPDGRAIYTKTAPHPAYGSSSPFVADQLIATPSGLQRRETQTVNATINLSTGAIQTKTLATNVNGIENVSLGYDSALRKFTATEFGTRVTHHTLDALGRPASIQVGTLSPSVFAYDDSATGRLRSVTQGNRRTTLSYFPADPSGGKAGYLSGILVEQVSPSATLEWRTFDRDLLGRITSEIRGPFVTSTTWDGNGNVKLITPSGRSGHEHVFDPTNQLISYTPPMLSGNPTVAYTYNGDKSVLTESRPETAPFTWVYDSLGRKDNLSSPAVVPYVPAGLLDYSYYSNSASPASGTPPGRVSAINGPYGVNLSFQYDGDLPTNVAWTGEVVGSVQRTYNNEFKLASEAVATTGASTVYYYGYGAGLANCVSPTTTVFPCPSNGIFINQREQSTGQILSNRIGSGAGDVVETFTYNAYGEVATQIVRVGTSTVMSIIYDDFATTNQAPRDALGRIIRKTELFPPATSVVRNYSYETARGYLLEVKDGSGAFKERYTYDDNGNQKTNSLTNTTTQTVFTDAQDRLASWNGYAYTHNANGDVIAGGSYSFGFDVHGNLIGMTLPGKSVEYLVDGLGRRVGRKLNGTIERKWLYRDKLRPVAELDGGGALLARYVYLTRTSTPDLVIKGSTAYRLISDHLGSPRLAINLTTGAVAYRADFTAFGVRSFVTAGLSDWIPFGFSGGLRDPYSYWNRFGAREYEAETGRWMQKDPIRFGGGLSNLYMYSGNDPINARDATGTTDEEFGNFLNCVGTLFACRVSVCAVPSYVTAGGCAMCVFGAAVGPCKKPFGWPDPDRKPTQTCNPATACCPGNGGTGPGVGPNSGPSSGSGGNGDGSGPGI